MSGALRPAALALLAVLAGCAAREERSGPAPVSRDALNPARINVEFRPVGFPIVAMYSGALLARDGKVYTTVSREKKPGRLLVYDPAADELKVAAVFTSGAERGGPEGAPLKPDEPPVLLGEQNSEAPGGARWLHGHDKLHARLFEGLDGRIYGATDSAVGNERPDNTRAYGGGHFFAFDPAAGQLTDLGWARRHEGLIAMTMDRERQVLYGLTWPSGLLVACRLGPDAEGRPGRRARLSILGLTSSFLESVPRYLEVLKDGRVFLCDGATGELLVYRPPEAAEKGDPAGRMRPGKLVRPTGLVTPAPADAKPPTELRESGRFRNWWRTGALAPDGLRIFTSCQRGGQLVEIDGSRGAFGAVIDHPHAKPWSRPPSDKAAWGGEMVEVLGFAPDGRLFYHAEGRLLTLEPASGRIRDWGLLAAPIRPGWKAFPGPGPAAFDDRGRMYFTVVLSEELPPPAPELSEDGGPDAPPEAPPPEKKRPRQEQGLGWINLGELKDGKLLYTESRKSR